MTKRIMQSILAENTAIDCGSTQADVIYRICQEALTNSIRHGKAKQISVILKHEPELIRLYIFDDGLGCKKITKGLGLSGMETRVNSLNGFITYGTSGENGFIINLTLPLESSNP